MRKIVESWNRTNFILKIVIGLVMGTLLGIICPKLSVIGWLGDLFVGSLKAIAPILVFFLVSSSFFQAKNSHGGIIKTVIILYLLSTIIAAVIAVVASTIFPVKMVLTEAVSDSSAPSGILEVLENIVLKLVQNPVTAISEANYIGILFWSILFGLLMKNSAPSLKNCFAQIADVITKIVSCIISLAPFGILGLAFTNMASGGLSAFATYGKLLILLIGCMLLQFFVTNPILVYMCTHKNPFPLIFYCLKRSAITAFFTRSSAANIPVNMEAAADLHLDRDTYSVTLPLGSTINMDGAAITITVMTLATVHTLGISFDIPTAILLSLMASVSACGASGVAGGSLLLIPLACSLFGIPDSISMQVVAVGFILGVVQDSVETALNSSSDLLLTAAAEFRQRRLDGKPVPDKFK